MATSAFNINNLVASNGDKGLMANALVDKIAHEQLEEQLQHQRRGRKVYIRNVLDVKDSEIIRSRYGGKYDLHLTQQEQAPHGLAGALRLCETLDCLDFFPNSGLRQDLVLDFGGSWVTHFLRGHNVHCCSPCLGVRDKMRHTERLMTMRKAILNDPQKFEGRQPNFCTSPAADCDVKAHFAISIHGGYDMGFQGLCQAMHAHGTTILKGTMMFDGAMLFDTEGFIPDLKCKWKKIKPFTFEKEDQTSKVGKLNSVVFSAARVNTLIAFDFVDESTLSYVHEWENVKSFLTDQTYHYKGMTYGIERCLIQNGIMTYKIIATPGSCPPELIRHCIWFPSLKDYVGLKIPTSQDLVEWKTVRLPLSTLRETEEIAMRCYNDKKNWMEQFKVILGVLSSKSSTIVINGMSMQSGERVEISDYHYIGFAILLHTKMKYEQLGKMYDMWNSGVIRKFFASLTRPLRVFLSGCVKTLFPTLRPRDEKEFLVKLSTFVTFNEVCQVDLNAEWDVVTAAAYTAEWAVEDGNTLAAERKKQADEKASEPVITDETEHQTSGDGLDASERTDLPDPMQSLSTQTKSPETRIAQRATAMLEYTAYETQLHNNTVSNLARIWCSAGGDNKTNSLEGNLHLVFDTYFAVDPLVNVHFRNGQWMRRVPDGIHYSVGYNETGLGQKMEGELYIVNADCVIANSQPLAQSTRGLLAPSGTISLVDGVAGCGKTTAIKKMFNPATDLIVTANKKSALDVRQALFNSTDSKEATTFVRTADSVLLNDASDVSRVLIDEVVLLHFGQLCAVMAKLKAVRAICFGDSEQIAFNSRDASFDMRNSKLLPDEVSSADTTFRSPQDVVPIVKLMATKALPKGTHTKYTRWVSQSKVQRSVSTRSVASVTMVDLSEDRFYITMTQADKAALISRAKELNMSKRFVENNIKTTHESQGISEDHVTLVRLKTTKCDLFKKFEYCLVAVTRHKSTFRYEHVGDLPGDLIAMCLTRK
ncbi:1a protein [Gayfeather mild mottle virus]|uniref:Replication protein 1a n=1 Tax=Gayfeather mild mottle virus TaxID=578305 RepID=C0MNB2_9BROM|nr:1a protein [Gayfeather mild mottle virus]CAT02556.1 1a protein [Gayfeather mild mottle virus]